MPYAHLLAPIVALVIVAVAVSWIIGFLTRLFAFIFLPVVITTLVVLHHADSPRVEAAWLYLIITVTLLLAADFWCVKNVTGRVLVGMRWWARTRADTGATEWAFESRAGGEAAGAASELDRRIFWWGLYAAPAFFGAALVFFN